MDLSRGQKLLVIIGLLALLGGIVVLSLGRLASQPAAVVYAEPPTKKTGTGQIAAHVAGYAATRAHEMETEDIGTVAIQFKSGAHGVLQGTTLTYKGMDTRLEVHGSKGNVVITADKISHWDVEGEPSMAEAAVEANTSASDPRAGLGDAVGAHAVQIEAFIAAIEGRGEPLVDAEEARRAVEFNLAVYESQRTGQKIVFPVTRTLGRF